MITPLDLADRALAERLLAIQHAAYAVEAELTARDGDPAQAADLFRRAAAMASSEPERRALRARIDELTIDEPTEETDE